MEVKSTTFEAFAEMGEGFAINCDKDGNDMKYYKWWIGYRSGPRESGRVMLAWYWNKLMRV